MAKRKKDPRAKPRVIDDELLKSSSPVTKKHSTTTTKNQAAYQTLPQDIEAERRVVVTLAYNQEQFPLAKHLTPDHFLNADCKDVFKKMFKVESKNRQWEPTDFPSILSLTSEVSSFKLREHVKRLVDRKMLLEVILQTGRIAKKAQAGDIDGVWDLVNDYTDISRDFYSQDGSSPGSWEDQAEFLPSIGWSWKGWIPNGFVTIIVGAPDIGKSAFSLALARSLACGSSLPDGTLPIESEGKVVWVDTESSEALNHLRAGHFGIPLDRIIVPTINSELFTDLNLSEERCWIAVEVACQDDDVKMLIVDSLGGSVMDENKPIAKATMKRLGMLARNFQIPVVVVHHPRKLNLGETDDITLDRVRGHSGIVQFARSIIAIERPDPLSEVRRAKVIKLNLGMKPDPVGFLWINDSIVWETPPTTPKRETVVDQVVELLRAYLHDGPRTAGDVEKEARGAGHSLSALQRGKKALGVVSKKKHGVWWWGLPTREV